MSTNYRVTTNDQFNDIPNHSVRAHSVFDQLALGLSTSLKNVWNYLKTIDVKVTLPINKNSQNQQGAKSYNEQSLFRNLLQRQTIASKVSQLKCPNTQKRAILPQTQSKDSNPTKKQRLQQKKHHKKLISFDNFLHQQQTKLNQSYIRKNIQQKKTLNRSILSQQNINDNSLIVQTNQNQNVSVNHNNDTILNISDIDSECNFNILNNSDVYDMNERKYGAAGNGEEEDDGLDVNDRGDERNLLKLQLAEYPFMIGRKLQLPKPKFNNNNINTNNKHTLSSTNTKTQPNKISSKSINSQQHYPEFIDVDNLHQFETKLKAPVKRGLSPSAIVVGPETKMRKRVKQSRQIDQYLEGRSDEQAMERSEMFDRLLEIRYDRMIEDMLNSGQKGDQGVKEQSLLTLKEDYQKYISKNFGAMQHIKKRIQNQTRQTHKLTNSKSLSNQPQQRKQKLSEILKPLDFQPQIPRKKLYNFTRQCESKINIKFELQKSVRQDKERQLAEEMRIQREEQEKRRKVEEERIRRGREEKMRLEEEERKRILRQQEALRIAEQMNNQQQKQDEQKVKQQTKSQQQQNHQQGQQLKSSEHKSDLQASKNLKPDETVAKQQKQSGKQAQKPLFLFGAAAASLFKNPTAQQSSTTAKQDKQTKQPQMSLFKKTSSIIQPKPSEQQKKVQSGSKQLQIPSTLQKKLTPKEQKQKKQTKYNPFLAAVTSTKPSTTKLQEIINSKKDDNSIFKTVIANTPASITSPQRLPAQTNPSTFMSPVNNKHNTSHYSNLDSSMCEESESNITPANSQVINNQASNLNGSFLNNSFSSQQQNTSIFPTTSSTNPLFSSNAGGSLFGNAYNPVTSGGLFGNPSAQQQKPPTSNGLFGNPQPNMFMSNPIASNLATQAVMKVPSFMQGHQSIAPGINPQNAVSLFNQRSPTKNQNQSLFSAPAPSLDKRNVDRRGKKNKEERIRG